MACRPKRISRGGAEREREGEQDIIRERAEEMGRMGEG
jgi:hypothetical protein